MRGAAYVFVSRAGVWTLTQRLAPSELPDDSNFGVSCGMIADHLVIGAPSSRSAAGVAYVYALVGATFVLEQKLAASDPEIGDHFANSVSIDPSTIVIGAENKSPVARGAAYVFARAAGGWSAPQKLVASDAGDVSRFGWSVAVDGTTLLVGAPFHNSTRGAAYAFTRSGATWSAQQNLIFNDAVGTELIGFSLALRGDTAVVGAYAAADYRGAAYVFSRVTGAWLQEQRLAAANPEPGARFGAAVALSDRGLFIGAPGTGDLRGSVYPFVRVGAQWAARPELKASDREASARFGVAVATFETSLLIGADGKASNRGQAYSFRLVLGNGDVCKASSECLSGFCVDGACCDTACGGGDDRDCQACTKAKGTTLDGVCGPAAKTTVCRPKARDCDVADLCDGVTMRCPADALAANGSACATGSCVAGTCTGPKQGVSGDGGAPELPGDPTPTSSCACVLIGSDGASLVGRSGSWAWELVAAGALALACRRRRRP